MRFFLNRVVRHHLCIAIFGSLVVGTWGLPANASILRIGSYNVQNNPDDLTEDSILTTIFEAIGNESVGGIAKRLDVLTLAETDTGSAPRLAGLLNGLYGVTTYGVVTSTPDGGSDRTAVVYDSATVALLENQVLADGLTHHSVRAKFRPLGTSGSADLYVYAIHLKSGTGATNSEIRAAEMRLLRADADGLGVGAHILYGGDFNMAGSSEGAWSAAIADGDGRGFDLADAPGEWRDNPDFKSLHTQDPRVHMDDRFDLQFVSGELLDGEGLDYLNGSFHVFGNNGTHVLGGAINTGTGASSVVLSALMSASDHLPIIADFVIPEPGTWALLAMGGMVFFARRQRG